MSHPIVITTQAKIIDEYLSFAYSFAYIVADLWENSDKDYIFNGEQIK